MLPAAAVLLVDDKARSAVVDIARSRELNVSRVYEATRSNLKEAFEALRADAADGVFGILLVGTLDLPGVSTRRLLSELARLSELNVEVRSAKEPFVTLKGDQAELVRWLHTRFSFEKGRNIANGIARSKKKAGRPRANIPVDEVLRMAKKGMSIRAIARRLKVGASTIQRFLAAHRAKQTDQETPIPGVRE